MVRRRLSGDWQPGALGRAHQVDAARCRQMKKVSTSAGQPDQFDITVDHQLFRQRRPPRQTQFAAALPLVHYRSGRQRFDLTMLGKGHVEITRVFVGTTHQKRVLDAVAVIGEQSDPRIGQLCERRELFPRT